MKTFRIQIRYCGYYADFNITCNDTPQDIENFILDKLGKNDIKWEHLGEMNDPRVKRITYEEVIDGGDNATLRRPVHGEEGSGSEVGAGTP